MQNSNQSQPTQITIIFRIESSVEPVQEDTTTARKINSDLDDTKDRKKRMTNGLFNQIGDDLERQQIRTHAHFDSFVGTISINFVSLQKWARYFLLLSLIGTESLINYSVGLLLHLRSELSPRGCVRIAS